MKIVLDKYRNTEYNNKQEIPTFLLIVLEVFIMDNTVFVNDARVMAKGRCRC